MLLAYGLQLRRPYQCQFGLKKRKFTCSVDLSLSNFIFKDAYIQRPVEEKRVAHLNFFAAQLLPTRNLVSGLILILALSLAQSCGLATGQDSAVLEPPAKQATEQEAQPKLNQAALKQVTYDIEYMSSDEMGGRQPGTPGIQLCEDYIVEEYRKAGLQPLENGTYLQELEVGQTRSVDKDATALILKGPNDTKLELDLGKDFQQLVGRKNFDLSSDLVFVGYGISAEEHNFDEYANVDVKDKVVVLIRYEPQPGDPQSVFDGEDTSRHATGRQKVSAARRAGAAGIIMVNDQSRLDEEGEDGLILPDRFGSNSLPFAQIKRDVFDKMLKASSLTSPLGKELSTVSEIEKLIDSNLEPISQPIKDWSCEFKSAFPVKKTKTNNIIGIIEGEGPNADETIVIGAHYDHLGMGAYGSRAGGRREVHNGADDNATGTAAVIELARRFSARDKKPGRRLVFVCFTAEEMGLLGAIHYCENPIYPLESTAAMMNFDMIGWLRENKLTLYNWNTSPQLDPIFEAANEGLGFDLNKPTRAFGGSDHLPFNEREVPNMFIHTGTNPVYHTPEDDFEEINCEGALRVIDYSERVVDMLAELETKPTFGTPKPFRLGVMLDDEEGGVKIEGVSEDSVAEKAGLLEGDIILDVDGEKMEKRRDLVKVLRRDAGKTVKMKLKRGDDEITLNVELKK